MPGPTFDENGEVKGRLELKVGGEWVTVNDKNFYDKETEVGCRQLGNELGYTLLSWDRDHWEDVPDGSGKQYYAKNCQGNEGDLSSCPEFFENSPAVHSQDVGLRCTFSIAGDECEECPPGKYRCAWVDVCRQEMIKIGLRNAAVPPSSQAASLTPPPSSFTQPISPNLPPLNPLLFQL